MPGKILNRTISSVPVHTWLLLILVCMVGYWPISSNLFSLKNDAYIYFLPTRYFISGCIQSGHLPLWNPYFYMGFPLHGDMQAGTWNPVVMFFSLFGKYNMSTLQYETLLYILIAGIGMYKLTGIISQNHFTKLVIAVSYMFCGFVIDTGQITVWTGSAAFIPFVFLYYYRVLYQKEHIYRNALKTTLALYFLLTAGYPSFAIMCCYVLFFSLLIYSINGIKEKQFGKNFFLKLLKANTLIAVAFLLIALPAILSYVDYLPYYQRASGASLSEAQQNPFNPFAVISYIFPLSVTRDHSYLKTDLTARSAYIGLFALLVIAAAFSRRKLPGLQKFIIAFTIFIFLFSLGDATPVRKICYNYFPFMNLFRHPGTMRIFTTIGLLLVSSLYLDDLFASFQNNKLKLYKWLAGVSIAAISIIVIFYLKSSNIPGKVSEFERSASSSGNLRTLLKDLYSNFSFADAIVLEGIVQVIFLCVFLLLIRKNNIAKLKWVVALFILNPVLLAQLSIPNTFVTQQSPGVINKFIASSPANYPIPGLHTTIAENNAIERSTNRLYGCAAFYQKKIVQVEEELNPSFTGTLKQFDSASAVSAIVMQYPVCYFADSLVHLNDSANIIPGNNKILFVDDTTGVPSITNPDLTGNISIKQFSPWGLFFETNTTERMPFVVFQNYNRNWKLFVDGKDTEIKKGNISFMYAIIEKGNHSLKFYYCPRYITYSILISLVTFLAITFFLIKKKRSLK